IDGLGGLWRRMPRTGLAFLVGAVAICGLPPLNGLVSELLVYLGLFHTAASGGGPWLARALPAPAPALSGAPALACLGEVFRAVLLGVARSPAVDRAHEAGPAMLVPMAILAAGCFTIGLGAPIVGPILDRAVAAWAPDEPAPALATLAPLLWISATGAALVVV